MVDSPACSVTRRAAILVFLSVEAALEIIHIVMVRICGNPCGPLHSWTCSERDITIVLEWMPDARYCLHSDVIGPAPISTGVRLSIVCPDPVTCFRTPLRLVSSSGAHSPGENHTRTSSSEKR